MQHNREALTAADSAVAEALKGGNVDEVVERIADDDALSALMRRNVRVAIQSTMVREDTIHSLAMSAMLYGFLWGHQVASDAHAAASA